MVNRRHSTVAMVMSVAVAVLFIAFGQKFDKVIQALASSLWLTIRSRSFPYSSCAGASRRNVLVRLGLPLTTALALVGSVLFLLGAIAADLAGQTRYSLYALGLLAVSYPFFVC